MKSLDITFPVGKKIGTLAIGGKGKRARLLGLAALARKKSYVFDVYDRSQEGGFMRGRLSDGRPFLLRDSARYLAKKVAKERDKRVLKDRWFQATQKGTGKLARAMARRERRKTRKILVSYRDVLFGGIAVMGLIWGRRNAA